MIPSVMIHGYAPNVWPVKTRDAIKHRCLARTIGADHRRDVTGTGSKGKIVYCRQPTEPHGQVFNLQQRVCARIFWDDLGCASDRQCKPMKHDGWIAGDQKPPGSPHHDRHHDPTK